MFFCPKLSVLRKISKKEMSNVVSCLFVLVVSYVSKASVNVANYSCEAVEVRNLN